MADTGYKMRLARVFEKALRTDGRTDRPFYKDAQAHLKTSSPLFPPPSPRYRNRRTRRHDCKDSANKTETRSPTEVTARSRTEKPILKRTDEQDETTTTITTMTSADARMERWNDDVDDEEEEEDATLTMTRMKKQILE